MRSRVSQIYLESRYPTHLPHDKANLQRHPGLETPRFPPPPCKYRIEKVHIHMATEEQIAANRLNAQSSSGPKTEAGRNRSRMNARRHGLTGQVTTMTDED